MPARFGRQPLDVLFLLVLAILFIQLGSVALAANIETESAAAGEEQGYGGSTIKLSTEALESIARLDDHQVEDNDAARADRMLAALEAIPEDERLPMGLDVEEMRAVPLAERLAKLQELWDVRQQELKEAYDAMPKVNELLMARIEVLQATDSSESALVLALTDLEDLLSDIDMARDFHSLEGFPVLASMLGVSRTEAVREMAAWAIGTAVKNEPKHQLWVLEDGAGTRDSALTLLLKNAVVAETSSLRSKVVYSLSACLSNNAQVQLKFGLLGGEAKLSAMYDADGSDSRLRTKVLVLLSDLLNEAARGSPAAALAIMPVGSTPKSGGAWCARADEALQQASSPVTLEKALEAVVSFAPSCGDQFVGLGVKQRLNNLAQQCRSSATVGSEAGEVEFHEELAQKFVEAAVVLV